jgi:hypothetical protein
LFFINKAPSQTSLSAKSARACVVCSTSSGMPAGGGYVTDTRTRKISFEKNQSKSGTRHAGSSSRRKDQLPLVPRKTTKVRNRWPAQICCRQVSQNPHSQPSINSFLRVNWGKSRINS